MFPGSTYSERHLVDVRCYIVGMIKEFREFAIKGNVIDMAVGVIIGAAFSGLVKSIVDDVLTPVLGLFTSGIDFANQFIVLKEGKQGPYHTLADAKAAGATVIAFGQALNAAISFLLISFVLFLVIRWINRLRRPDTPPAPSTKSCAFCRSHIDEKARRCPFCTSSLTEA